MWENLFLLQEVEIKIKIDLKEKNEIDEKIYLEDGKKAKESLLSEIKNAITKFFDVQDLADINIAKLSREHKIDLLLLILRRRDFSLILGIQKHPYAKVPSISQKNHSAYAHPDLHTLPYH